MCVRVSLSDSVVFAMESGVESQGTMDSTMEDDP